MTERKPHPAWAIPESCRINTLHVTPQPARSGVIAFELRPSKDTVSIRTVERPFDSGGRNGGRRLEASHARVPAAPVATHVRVHVLYDRSDVREPREHRALEDRPPNRAGHGNPRVAAHAHSSG